MLIALSDILGFSVQGSDRAAGKVEDIFIEDVLWKVEYVAIADAGGVSMQPASIGVDAMGAAEMGEHKLHVNLTHDQIAGGRDVSGDLPVSQHVSGRDDPHLQSVREICGYTVCGSSEEMGTLDNFIADDEDWKIHFITIRTGAWNGNKTVLVGPGLINEIDFGTKTAHVELDRHHIAKSPVFDPAHPIVDEREIKLAGRTTV